jgi:hypothetical protein
MIKFKEFLEIEISEADFSKAQTTSTKNAHALIKEKMKNEDHQDALMSLYDDLNEENQQLFEEMLEADIEKLLEFALSRIGE